MSEGKRRYHQRNLTETCDSFIAQGERLIEELFSTASTLPIVDPDGSSDCGFAESLYAQKEKCQENLCRWIGEANHILAIIAEELNCLHQTKAILHSGADRTVNSDPRMELDNGAQAALRQSKKVAHQQIALSSLLIRANQTIGLSRKIRFPGGKPRQATPPLFPSGGSASFPPTRLGGPPSPQSSRVLNPYYRSSLNRRGPSVNTKPDVLTADADSFPTKGGRR